MRELSMQILNQQSSQTSSSTAFVLQGECGISNSKSMATGSFGPCYVLVGHDPKTKYSFIAHISVSTNFEDIRTLFSKLKSLNVDLNDLTGVRLLGGWTSGNSIHIGPKIITILNEEGLGGKVDLTYFQQKVSGSTESKGDSSPHYNGGLLNPQTGTFSLFKTPWDRLEQKGFKSNLKVVTKLFKESNVDLNEMSLEEWHTTFFNFKITKQLPLKMTIYSSETHQQS